ncbi:MAG: AAA family ATPase [Desulfobacteraceae bacterium]|nr:AAA family ATPase [Desulfobacteraceae bacterium]MBC2758057.1 AAA family ATPase [Desulfobacteraceae bacterium]
MKCPKCQTENPEDNKFCRKCGSKFLLNCSQCGSEILFDDQFCGKCGHNLQEPEAPPDYTEPQSYTPKFLADKILTTRSSIEGERKLVTVLFADVAGFTSMSEKLDPEEVHQIMDGCFKILMDEIHKFEGTINQFTGDGVMALFGAPVSHEDHAQRACYSALSIQKAIGDYNEKVKKACGSDFKMRIGLNSGPVIVGSIGDDLRMDYTAVGDTTNLAARMENSAESGTVLASKNTYKIVSDFFKFDPLKKIEVKGKEEPQEAFKLIRKSELETRIAASAAKGLTRFVGRKNSITGLMEAYEKVQSGSGQVVGLVGEAGVGKSRLVLEFRNQLPHDEFTFLEGQCLHYGGAMAYLPVLDILKSYFDIADDDREFIIRKKIEEKILRLDENLKNVFTPFHDLFSLKVDDEAYLQVEPSERKMRVIESLRDLFVRESQNKPLILAIDDLHWIDKISEEFINYLIGWLQNTKILLILLYRPEYTHQWGSKSYYTKVGLTQLGNISSNQLVQSILEDREVVPEIRELILKRAGGNPLFVEELTHNLIENGSIERQNQQYVLTKKASNIQVPDTIQGIIAARIDRIEESLKQVMQMASVIGREFAFRVLESTMGMREALKSNLLNLQGLEFISEKQLFPELEYIFKHALTQEVAYNSLLQKRRKEIHEKVGSAIETLYPDRIEEYYELLAYHYRRSNNTEKALHYLDKANQKAARLNAMQEAMSYFNETMELLDTLDETPENQKRRISLIANQAYVFALLLRIPEYYDLLKRYEPMAADSKETELLAMFYSALAVCEANFGHFDQSIETGTKAIEFSNAAGSPESAYNAYFPIILSYACTCQYDKTHELNKEIQSMLEKQFDLRVYVYSFWAVSLAFMIVGQFDKAIQAAQKALKMAEKYSDNGSISISSTNIAVTHCHKGDIAQALEYAEMGVSKAQTPVYQIRARTVQAWILCHAGESRQGTETLSANLPVIQMSNYLAFEVSTLYYLGEAYWLAGEYDKATQTLKDLLKLSERCKMKRFPGIAYYYLGEIALKTDPQQARAYFKKSIDIFQAVKAEDFLARAYAGYGRFYKQQGDIDKAREYLTKALEIFERLGILNQPEKVKKELADLPPDEG